MTDKQLQRKLNAAHRAIAKADNLMNDIEQETKARIKALPVGLQSELLGRPQLTVKDLFSQVEFVCIECGIDIDRCICAGRERKHLDSCPVCGGKGDGYTYEPDHEQRTWGYPSEFHMCEVCHCPLLEVGRGQCRVFEVLS